MGIEAAFLDGVLFRVLMKESVKRRFVWMRIANMMNASIASAIGLAYVVHHPTHDDDRDRNVLTLKRACIQVEEIIYSAIPW